MSRQKNKKDKRAVRVTPPSVGARVEVLLNGYYSGEDEECALVHSLLDSKDAQSMVRLFGSPKGRHTLRAHRTEATLIVTRYSNPVVTMNAYLALPQEWAEQRLLLLERLVRERENLFKYPWFSEKFSEAKVLPAERALLERGLGNPGLVARLLRGKKGPSLVVVRVPMSKSA